MSPDASALLAWLAGRGGTATVRDFGDTAPRRFRKAGTHGPLVAELLAAGRIVETCARPRTYAVVTFGTAGSSRGAKLRRMLAEAAADLDVPPEFAAYFAATSVRDRLVLSMRASAGLPRECECCGPAAAKVDEAVADAFDCEL